MMKWVRRYTVRSCCWIIEKSTITDVSNANVAILTSETKRKEKEYIKYYCGSFTNWEQCSLAKSATKFYERIDDNGKDEEQ